MNELDHRGKQGVVFAPVFAGARHQHDQHRAQAFAAAQYDVLAQLVDQDHVGGEVIGDNLVDAQHIAVG